MSANLCSHATIHAIVDFTRSHPPSEALRLPAPQPEILVAADMTFDPGQTWFDPRAYPTLLGRGLLVANFESLRARYGARVHEHFGNGEACSTYLARRHAFIVGALPGKRGEELGHVLKQLDYFDYQSCEVENYDATWAAQVTNILRRLAIRKLPGYREASWGL